MKVILGIAIWTSILIGLLYWIKPAANVESNPATQVATFIVQPRHIVELKFAQKQLLKVGDMIFGDDPSQKKPIGRIVRVESNASQKRELVFADFAVAEFFSSSPALFKDQATITYHETPTSLEWVVATMLPPKKREEISQLIMGSLDEHREVLWNELQPVLAKALTESQFIIQRHLRTALEKRSEQFSAIAKEYQAEFIETELIPVLEKEVWPIVREETGPLVEVVGSEIWNQASVWRLTWRYLYDASPLPQHDLTRKEFDRFVDSKAIPILKKHVSEFLEAQNRVINRIANNVAVQDVFQAGLQRVSHDEKIKTLLNEIFLELFVDNDELRNTWRSMWESPEMKSVMANANERLGPTVTQIGESLFGNPNREITPEFSEVLRSKVLFKDRRWFVLHIDNSAETGTERVHELFVTVGSPHASRPFHVPATKR